MAFNATLKPLLAELDARSIAEQLTLMDVAYFKRLREDELSNLNWTQQDKEYTAPNVLAMLDHFNLVSHWTTCSILFCEEKTERYHILEKMIDICVESEKLGNYSGLFAIMSGIATSAVARLKKTFKKLSKSHKASLSRLEDLCSPSRGYEVIRSAARGPGPAIPYLGLLLMDLTFIEDGNQDGPLKGDLNRKVFAGLHATQELWRVTPMKFTENVGFQERLRSLHFLRDLDSNELFEISYFLEPIEGRQKPERPASLGNASFIGLQPSPREPTLPAPMPHLNQTVMTRALSQPNSALFINNAP